MHTFTGGPGCGKGTQCNLLHHDFGFTHLSAGELLREEAKTDTDHGREILTAMKRGAIVPAVSYENWYHKF